MRLVVLRVALFTAALAGVGCTAYTRSAQSNFFSEFSLRQLVDQHGSRHGLDCSTGGAGGGGGGGSASGKQFRFHKAESLACRLSGGAGKFDEAGFIAALKEEVESDIRESGAKVTGGGPGAGRFHFEYEGEAVRGRVEITGRPTGEDYYSVKADLEERDKGEAK